jgi:hypothetical protein
MKSLVLSFFSLVIAIASIGQKVIKMGDNSYTIKGTTAGSYTTYQEDKVKEFSRIDNYFALEGDNVTFTQVTYGLGQAEPVSITIETFKKSAIDYSWSWAVEEVAEELSAEGKVYSLTVKIKSSSPATQTAHKKNQAEPKVDNNYTLTQYIFDEKFLAEAVMAKLSK